MKKYNHAFNQDLMAHALDQGCCPNCNDFESNEKGIKGVMFHPIWDKEFFEGYVYNDCGYYFVFKCGRCHEKFWFHIRDITFSCIEHLQKKLEEREN